MTGHFGFSYVGLLFLLLLFIPNIIWTTKSRRDIHLEMKTRYFCFVKKQVKL